MTENFVLATDEVWRLQGGYDFNKYRAAGGDDPECLAFQDMAAQGHYGAGGGTKQGIYVCAPSGKFLAAINSLSPEAVKNMLESGLDAWNKLPEEDRRAKPPSAKPNHRWEWSYPEKGLVLKQTARYLREEASKDQQPDPRFNFDFAWFSPEEAAQLIPDAPSVGQQHQVPGNLYRRLARYNLLDNAHGETGTYHADEVLGKLMVEVLSVEPEAVRIRISGTSTATAGEAEHFGLSPARRIQVDLLGFGEFDPREQKFRSFELVGKGKIYETSTPKPDEKHARMIGWYFALADPDRPVDRIFPTHLRAYDAPWVKKPKITLQDLQSKPSDRKKMNQVK